MELQQYENSIELTDDTSLSEMNACNSADDVNLALECDDGAARFLADDSGRHSRQTSSLSRKWYKDRMAPAERNLHTLEQQLGDG